jgi:hypothetical protein
MTHDGGGGWGGGLHGPVLDTGIRLFRKAVYHKASQLAADINNTVN